MEDLQLYVRAARLIRPRLTPEAQRFLVDSYVLLRTNDSVGVSRSSYRITVRQLESLIRLSEARARLDLSSRVTVVHVKEAARLLKKSIVRVETGDVMLEEELEAEGDADLPHDADADQEWHADEEKEGPAPSSPSALPSALPSATPSAPPAKRTLQLKVSEYNAISLSLRRLLRLHEASADNPYRPNMKQQHLIQAYMERYRGGEGVGVEGGSGGGGAGGGSATGEGDVEEQMRRLRLIIQLVINDGKVLVVKPSREDRERLEREDGEEEEREGRRVEKVMKRLLACHPNFDGVDEEEGAGGKMKGKKSGYGQVRGGVDRPEEEEGKGQEEREERGSQAMEQDEKEEKGEGEGSAPAVQPVQRVDSTGSVVGSGQRKRARGRNEPVVKGTTLVERPAPLSPESPSTPSTGGSTGSRRSARGEERRTPRS